MEVFFIKYNKIKINIESELSISSCLCHANSCETMSSWIVVHFSSDNTSSVINTKTAILSGKLLLSDGSNDCKVLFKNDWYHRTIRGRFKTKKEADFFLKNCKGKMNKFTNIFLKHLFAIYRFRASKQDRLRTKVTVSNQFLSEFIKILEN